MLKKIAMLMLVFFSTHALANIVTIKASQTQNNKRLPWKIETKDDGYYQILGSYDHKKFIVYVSPFHDGKLSDPIIVNCNAGNGSYETHEVAPGAILECYPHFNDIISIYIDQKTFQHGSEGDFRYEPYDL